jgi:hypothetical protein
MAGLLIFGAFVLSQDFQPGHLANPSAEEANFRTGRYGRFSAHWYQRADFRGLAQEASSRLGPEGILVLDRRTHPTCRYSGTGRVWVHLPEGIDLARRIEGEGWRELWSAAPVAYGLSGLAEMLEGHDDVIYAMHLDDRVRPFLESPEGPVGASWQFELEYVDRSGRIGLFRLIPR